MKNCTIVKEEYVNQNDIYSNVVGWVIDPESNVPYDNYVDFDKNKSAFIKGENPSVLLEFNVI